jgi:hydrogenase expression/formation protein HypC
MCLGDLGEVLEVSAPRALVRTGPRTVTVSLLTLDEPVRPGDWVVCHSGYALSRLTPEQAHEAQGIRAGLSAGTTARTTAGTTTGTTTKVET